jgi:hypothetical protein
MFIKLGLVLRRPVERDQLDHSSPRRHSWMERLKGWSNIEEDGKRINC